MNDEVNKFLPILTAALMLPDADPIVTKAPKVRKRDFTDDELAHVRSLPKRERQKAIAVLQEKYRKETK